MWHDNMISSPLSLTFFTALLCSFKSFYWFNDLIFLLLLPPRVEEAGLKESIGSVILFSGL